MTYKEAERAYNAEIHRLAEETFSRYCRNLYDPLYLVGSKDAAGHWDRFSVATEQDIEKRPELSFVSPQALPKNATIPQYEESVLRPILNKEPLKIFAECV